MSLSLELHARCRAVLLQCSELDSDNSLKAIFVTSELRIFRDGLPQCTTKEDRVSQTIDYLVPLRLSNNRPVFPLFLAELRERRHPGDGLRDELDTLLTSATQTLTGKVFVPLVVAAMTQVESTELMEETVFVRPDVSPAEHTQFLEFKRALQEHGFNDLHAYYGQDREAWRPPACPQESIREIIHQLFDQTNRPNQALQSLPALVPHFLSADFFGDRIARRQVLRHLRQSGGVLIIDAISLFHPMINRSISHSDLGSNKQVAVLIVSPIDAATIPVNQLIEQVIDLQLETVLARFDHDLDHMCEIGLGDLRALKRWLFSVLPETATNVQKQRPNPGTLEQFQQMRGEEPQGIHRAFYGQGGLR